LCLAVGATETASQPIGSPSGTIQAGPAPVKSPPSAAVQEQSPTYDRNAPGAAKKSPISRAALCDTAALIARTNDLPVAFFTRLIQQESGFDPTVVSRAGAQGIAQFMPKTASFRGLADPFEPVDALAASGKYLAELVRQFGNLGLAAAAYNAGARRVQDWLTNRIPLPTETRHYVYSITGRAADTWAASQPDLSRLDLSPAASCQITPEHRVYELAAQPTQPQITGAGTASPRMGAERRSLPRPSQFIVGRPVPAAIRDTEARVLAKMKRQPGAKQTRRDDTRVASTP
jgi:hypothetical protein